MIGLEEVLVRITCSEIVIEFDLPPPIKRLDTELILRPNYLLRDYILIPT